MLPLTRIVLSRVGVALLTVVTLAQSQSIPSPIIDVGYTQYQGFVDTTSNITQFLGMRYAAPPIGDLRFRAPQPPPTEAGVQAAVDQPNWCMQSGDGTATTNPFRNIKRENPVAPEDCLFLKYVSDVDACTTPVTELAHHRATSQLWCGSMEEGMCRYIAGAAIGASGEDVVKRSNNGVIVVVIQYRLGVFGFLAGSAVKNDGALNAGLRKFLLIFLGYIPRLMSIQVDQDFALRWVQTHISKFGGDPSKVTIWGQSAGAGSVLQHVIANGGKTEPQLFRGAITSSTFLPSQYNYDDKVPEWIFNQVVAQTNCSSAVDAMTCLRAVDQSILQTANAAINNAGFYGTFTTVPVVDGEFIVQRPTLSLIEGKVNGQALMSTTNTNEGVDFVNQSVPIAAGQYSELLFPEFTEIQSLLVGLLYGGLGTDLFQDNAIMGESIFICPTYFLLSAFKGRAWKGEFAVPPALHSDDYAYYWPNGVAPPFNNTDFINAFAQIFTSFIVNLDPNDKLAPTISPKWDQHSEGNTEMLFNKTENNQPDIRAIETSLELLERCAFWDSVGPLIGQ
ncbi:Carboxylic ester hydrolase [Mycena sanguinolenta]|uniref:Carboxylic ester hydrolase n=1 Tax=Mycena sanguinolenta TaxID=230812 RepID=A0A8H6ZFQ1_9AGAR|nr:Carboxylic ester hydrolase [Mycena sanguinolenta]